MRFNNLGIRGKLIAGFGAILLLIVAISGFNMLSTNRIKDEAAYVRDNASKRSTLSMHIKLAVVQVQQWLTDSSATGWSDGFDEAENWAVKFREQVAQLKELLSDPEDLRGLEAIERSFEDYYSMGVKMARAYVDEGREFGNRVMKEFDAYAEDINQKVDKFEEEGHHQLEMALKAVNDRADSAGKTGIWITILAILISVTLSLLLASRIVRPINKIVDVVQGMAEGDLTRTVEVGSKDEIGLLGEAFNRMVLGLHKMVESIMDTSDGVATSAAQISASSVQVSKGAELQASAVEQTSSSIAQMSSSIASVADDAQSLASNVAQTTSSIEEMTASINQVSSSTDQLASSVDQTSSSIEEMAASIEQVSKNIKEVSQVADEAASEANGGREAVEQVIEGMADVRERMEELAGVIGRLDQSSREIGTIIEVIDDIAEQTNLLALNAAIESARAGEAGRGFAVVADEVRKLAERSSKATREIADLIKGIQSETTSAVGSANSSREIVERGTELSNRAGEALEKILGSSERTARLMGEMAQATEEQNETSKQIVKATEDMNSLTQQIAGALKEQALGSEEINKAVAEMSRRTEQVSGATQEQQRTGEQVVKATETISGAADENRAAVVEMSRSAEDLAKQAEGLKGLISAFKVSEDGSGNGRGRRTEIALVDESTRAEDVIR